MPDHKLVNVLKKKSMTMAAFTFFVAMLGAIVAGNDAGLIYNTYPMMADRWFPSDYFHPYMNPIQNLFENGTAVQFNHRHGFNSKTRDNSRVSNASTWFKPGIVSIM